MAEAETVASTIYAIGWLIGFTCFQFRWSAGVREDLEARRRRETSSDRHPSYDDEEDDPDSYQPPVTLSDHLIAWAIRLGVGAFVGFMWPVFFAALVWVAVDALSSRRRRRHRRA